MEPTEAQYLILNALGTLGLLEGMFYDQGKGFWYITTPSPVLPTALLLQNGDIAPIELGENQPSWKSSNIKELGKFLHKLGNDT